MKKLMTMIAAVATAFGLYATDFATHEMSFSDYTEATQYDLSENEGTALYWKYDGKAKGEYEVSADLVAENGALTIKSGSKVLSRQFMDVTEDGGASLANTNLYVAMDIDFMDQGLDDVPTAAAGAKIALFALDGSGIDGIPEALKGTNLFVMAAHGNAASGKAIYKLMAIDNTVLTGSRKIALKAYNAAVGTQAGFIIDIQTGDTKKPINPVVVESVYALDADGKVVWTDVMGSDYLGGLTTSADVSKWVSKKSLFVSMDTDPDTRAKLASVDFVGNAKLASIKLTDTMEGWPLDNVSMPLELTEAEITDLTKGYEVLSDGTAIVGPAEGPITFKVSTTKQYVTVTFDSIKKNPGEDGVYTIDMAASKKLTVEGWDADATVTIGGVETPYPTIGEAIDAANGAGEACTLKLSKDLEDRTEALAFTGTEEITLDLNGKAITGAAMGGLVQNSGNLKIIDSSVSAAGYIDNTAEMLPYAVLNSGALVIAGGWFKDAVAFGDVAATINVAGGKFDAAFDSTMAVGMLTITGGQFKGYTREELEDLIDKATYQVVDGEEGYLMVQEIPAPTTFAVTAAAAADNSTLTVQVDGEDIPGKDNVYTANIGDTIVVTYTADPGYEFNGQPTVTDSFEEDDDTTFATAPIPTIKTFKLTIPEVEHANAVVSNDTEDVQIDNLDAIAYGTEVTVYWTAEAGWKITDGATEQITMTEAKTAEEPTVEADAKDPASDDPTQIPDNETAATRYGNRVPAELANVSAKVLCTWATTVGKLSAGEDIIENAFLLNCENDPDVVAAAEKAFKATSITVNSDGTVTIGEPEGYNGTIEQWGKIELEDADWVKDLEGAKFFELKLVPLDVAK